MSVGVGLSRHPEVRAAAREAAERALDAGHIGKASCLFVGGTVDHLDQSIDLCEELREVAGAGVQIVGAAVGAVLVRGDSSEDGPALGVLAVEGPAWAFSWQPEDPSQLRKAALAAGPGALALVFADPAAPLNRLAAALVREGPKLVIAGGGASAEGGLILDDDLADAPAVGLILPAPGRVVLAQSHQPIGQPSLVSSVEGRLIHELDGKPALEVMSRLQELPGLRDLEGALPFLGLGVSPAPGEAFDPNDFLSVPLLGIDEETGALAVGSRVDEGHSVSFTLRDGMGSRRALQSALAGLGKPARPKFGCYFDCASRGTDLYGVDELDLSIIEKELGRFPLLSFRTSFELGPSGGGIGLHMFTGVLALGG